MARRERVRRQPRADTRRELIDAAGRVFAKRGFHGASVEAVADEAGYSTGAVYSSFVSKEELFLSLWEERIQRRRRELEEAVQDAGGGQAGVLSATADVRASLERDSDWFLLYFEFALHAARSPRFARRFRKMRAEGLAELEVGLADGLRRAGVEASVSPAELAAALRALSYGLAIDRLVGAGRDSDALFGRVVELLFRGMRVESA